MKTDPPARVLVVDDDALSRKKFSAELRSMGLGHEVVADGQAALDRLREGGVDVLLLDILMPGKTGFDVLGEMRREARLSEVPVLVISSLDQTEDIVRALELGAVDFLPKDVAPPIFRARVAATLEKKRLRDAERRYLDDVEELTEAARMIREGHTAPGEVPLTAVAQRRDGLGNLARVFAELAQAVHARETRARQRINLLQGSLLLLIMGLTWGVVPALSKILVAPGSATNPIGMAAWVAVVTVSCAGLTLLATGRRPHVSWPSLRFGLVAGLFAGVLPQSTLFWVSSHVPGVVLSITLALESLIVFAIAATLRVEKPSLTRLLGLLVGLIAVFVIMATTEEAEGVRVPLWILAGLLVPLSYAVQSILVASMPGTERRAPLELLFFVMLGSALWGWTAALLTGAVISPWAAEPTTLALIAAIGVISAISNGSYILTIRRMGAVFASQYAYVVTIMGVGWSVLLLGERMTVWVWFALGCVLCGIFMVRPKAQDVQLSEILRSEPPEGGSSAIQPLDLDRVG
ncbi:MAG: response regulator [Pseudomonadota bacterium]